MYIWMYWKQGWDKAPEICKRCRDSWIQHNPEHEVVCLDKKSVRDFFKIEKFIREFKSKTISVQSYTDILRTNLLCKYGGAWCDATIWCNMPMEEWMPDNFFAFSKPTKHRLVASWFLSCEKQEYIIKKWRLYTKEYWSLRKKHHNYYWFHLLFNEIYNKDKNVQNQWDKQKKIGCGVTNKGGPHCFWPYTKERIEEIKKTGIPKDCPVFKLRYNKKLSSYPLIRSGLFGSI